jgi:sulfate transport system substrate-binding protein
MTVFFAATLFALIVFSGCLPKPLSESGGMSITLYGFSIMKESLEKSIFPEFIAKWKSEHGVDVRFAASFAGSETITNQILQGVKAQIAILSIERDAQRLRNGGAVTSDWHALPQKGIVNKTPFVILVRKGNPKNIRDFSDLAKPGIKLIHPDPESSGGAQWSILAIYGSELMKSEKQSGKQDQAHAVQVLKAIWANVFSTPGSAREARNTFEQGYGDALITYELEGLLLKDSRSPIETIIPQATIFSEHPVVVVDRNVTPAQRPIVDAFVRFLSTDEAQRAFVKNYFRSSTNDALTQENKELATITYPFTVEYFGGWDKAYPEVIEGVFKSQVQKRK